MSTKAEIIPYEPGQHTELVARIRAIEELRSSEVFIKGVHYGEPYKGAGKDVLLKAGAETIMSRFHLWPEFIERSTVEQWDQEHPVFHYRYECRLIHRETGHVWGAGIGSCNSLEDKYRWRKSERKCPNCGEPKIIKSKYADRKTGVIGWYCLACKASFDPDDSRVTSQEEGKVPNPDVFTLVNTIDKMAQKRALVAAVLIATGASAYFTQDVEDFPEYSGVIYDGETVTPKTEPPAQPKAAPKPQPAPVSSSPVPSDEPKADTPVPSALDEHFGPRNGHVDDEQEPVSDPETGEVFWTRVKDQVVKLIRDAELFWKIGGSHLYNRIAVALGLPSENYKKRDQLIAAIALSYTRTDRDAWAAIEAYKVEEQVPA